MTPAMKVEVRSRGKGCRTLFAAVWILARVTKAKVTYEVTFLRKRTRTHMTVVWRLATVDPNVINKGRATPKSPGTLRAVVGLLSTIVTKVALQFRATLKGRATHVTGVWILVTVNTKVVNEVMVVDKPHKTDMAVVESLATVSQEVVPKVRMACKRLGAFFTLVCRFAAVNLKIRLQGADVT